MGYIEKFVVAINKWISYLAGGALAAMVIITVINVVLRQVYVPFVGCVEIVTYLGVIVVGFSLGYTQIRGAHIAIDILASNFSQKTNRVLEVINRLMGMCLFGVIAWRTALYATHLKNIGSLSETLKIIFYPVTYCLAFGCMCLALLLFVYLVKAISKVLNK